MKARVWTQTMALVAFATALVAVAGPPAAPALAGCAGPDPAPTRLEVVNHPHYGPGVVGVVTNRGSAAYSSAPGEQAVYLYEGRRLVREVDFTSLKPGGTVDVSYYPARGAFARGTTFTLILVYNPDIHWDGNSNNDDCRTGGTNRMDRTV